MLHLSRLCRVCVSALVLSLVASGALAQQPARWTKAAPFPIADEELYGVTAGGKMYVVGENGPELLMAGTNGTVIPNGATSPAGGVVVNVIEAPGGGGKVPVNPGYILRRTPERVIIRNFEGQVFEYPDGPEREARFKAEDTCTCACAWTRCASSVSTSIVASTCPAFTSSPSRARIVRTRPGALAATSTSVASIRPLPLAIPSPSESRVR